MLGGPGLPYSLSSFSLLGIFKDARFIIIEKYYYLFIIVGVIFPFVNRFQPSKGNLTVEIQSDKKVEELYSGETLN